MTGPIRSKGKARASDYEEVKHLPQSQPPRPPNAWILYRSDKIKVLPPAQPGQRSRAQADVSKLISDMWRNESDAVKLEYERLADARKAEHQRLYPDYRFQPMKKEEK
ncbi:high mobility group box domain-containing protein, partial [Suillus americanus]